MFPVRLTNKVLQVAGVLPLSSEFFAQFEKLNPDINLLVSAVDEERFLKLTPVILDIYSGAKKGLELPNHLPPMGQDQEKLEDFLQFSLMFSQLPKELLTQIYPYCKLKNFSPGEIIADQGQVCDHLILIKTGKVELTKKNPRRPIYCHIENLTTYDSIGEIHLVGNTAHAMRATATSEVITYQIPKQIFVNLLKRSAFSVPLCITLAGRLQSLNLVSGIELEAGLNVTNGDGRKKLGLFDEDKILEEILEMAVLARASDIHFERLEDATLLRCRIDGDLIQLWDSLPRERGDLLLNRIKILAKLDIAERRLPQDGQFNFPSSLGKINFRVSILPTRYGEKCVLRVLKSKGTIISLSQLAPDVQIIKFLNSLVRYRQGLFLVAGPTGSGKTTTLYSLLNQIDRTKSNVVTIEDPIELDLPNTNQTQVNEEIGLGYENVLRNILRQDPDVILVGEIRDRKSLEMVFQAALTGHLVLATVHATNSIEVIPRLLDLGASYEQIASVLLGSMSQRLIRAICPDCKSKRSISKKELAVFNHYLKSDLHTTQVAFGKGCAKCNNSGYHGRVPLFEYWKKTDEIRDVILQKNGISNLLPILKAKGFEGLGEYGLKMVAMGLTTVDEVENTLFGLSDFSME